MVQPERVSPDDMAWLAVAQRAVAEALIVRTWTERVVSAKYGVTPQDRIGADGTIKRAPIT